MQVGAKQEDQRAGQDRHGGVDRRPPQRQAEEVERLVPVVGVEIHVEPGRLADDVGQEEDPVELPDVPAPAALVELAVGDERLAADVPDVDDDEPRDRPAPRLEQAPLPVAGEPDLAEHVDDRFHEHRQRAADHEQRGDGGALPLPHPPGRAPGAAEDRSRAGRGRGRLDG